MATERKLYQNTLLHLGGQDISRRREDVELNPVKQRENWTHISVNMHDCPGQG